MQNTSTSTADIGLLVQEYSDNLAGAFMGRRICPPIMGEKEKGDYDLLELSEMTKIVGDLQRTDSSAFARVRHTHTTDSFETFDYGLEEPIADAAMMRSSWSKRVKVARSLQRAIMVEEEYRWATLLFNETTFSGYTKAITNEWDDLSNATPINDVADGRLQLVRQLGGIVDPEMEIVLAISEAVFVNLTKCTQIIAAQSGGTGSDTTKKKSVSKAELAGILNISAVETSAIQRNAADIWDDEYALLFVRSMTGASAATPARLTEGTGDPDEVLQLGRTIIWEAMADIETMIKVYREEEIESDIVRVRQYQDEKVMVAGAGVLFTNVTS